MSMDAPRRFYKEVACVEAGDGFTVTLDGRALKTPAKAALVAPTRALAEACADEWRAQGAHILPSTMPLTRLVNVAIDQTPRARADLIAHVAKYGETDLLCHRAAAPPALAARERAAWDSVLDWGEAYLGVRLPVVIGVVAADVPAAEREKLGFAAAQLDDFRLTGLAHAVGLSGSAILGFALAHGALDAEAVFEAVALGELWSLETWGEDGEARGRLTRQKAEFEALARYFASLA